MAMWSDGGFVEFRRDARMHEHVDTSMIRKMVRCIKSRNHKDITIGNKYSVVSTCCGWVEIINDKGIEKAYCDDLFENVPNDELKTIPVREVTWQDVIDEKIPCYFWDDEYEFDDFIQLRKIGTLEKPIDDENKSFRWYNETGSKWEDYDRCKPINSAIVVVEPKKPEKKYRPFRTFDEVMEAMKVHGQWIVNKNKDYYLFVHTLNFQNERQMNETFKGYQFLDGTPFGVLIISAVNSQQCFIRQIRNICSTVSLV